MRKMIIIFVSLFGIIAALLIILLTLSLVKGNSFSGNPLGMKLVNEKNVDLTDITSINIKYTSENITFLQSDSKELIFKEYMSYNPKDNELSRLEVNGNELNILDAKPHIKFSIFPLIRNHKVEIYLPEGYTNDLNVYSSSGNIQSSVTMKLSDFNIECTSGNLKFNEVYADKINAKVSSGNIYFMLAEGDRQFSANSGNIRVMGGTGDSTLHTSSGNITVENASGYMDISASSGEISVTSLGGGGRLEASSGNIDLELNSLSDNLDIHASSGNVKLYLPNEDISFRFNADASSGNINTFFDDNLNFNKRGNSASGTVGVNPTYDINIETTSGNIRVRD